MAPPRGPALLKTAFACVVFAMILFLLWYEASGW
jgi:hypothetical protein